MRAALIVTAIVVLVTGGLIWWLTREPSVPTPGTTPVTDGRFDEPPAEFRHAERDTEDGFDAGVGRVMGRVLSATDTPAPGARVRFFAAQPELGSLECSVCELPVMSCGHHSTVRKLIDGIRAQTFKPPQPLAEVVTGPDGSFVFEGVPLDGIVFATLGARSAEEWAVEDEQLEVMLSEPTSREVLIYDAEQKQLPGIKVGLYEPYEGTLREARSDGEGHLTLTSSDPWAWVFVDQEGMLPVGAPLESLSQFTLSGPKTLIVHTVMGGQPVEADVSLLLHRQERKFRSKDGVLRLDSLPLDYYTVTVGSDALASSEQSVELVDPVTELTFELRRGARVMVTAVSATGEPLEYVHGSLQGNDGSSSAEAENGALLVIGPVPEGEYTLSVDARDMVTVTRQLDLQPGETNLEITMRVAPTLSGKVLLPDGKPANNVRVSALESDSESALDFVGEDGAFSLSLQYPGTYVLRAQSNRDGLAELTVTVPCDPVTLTLNPKGAIEVELFDFDGTPMMPNFIVRSDKGGQVSWINGGDEEGGMVGRLAGLESGSYTLEREIEDRVPLKKTVEVVEGKTTRVSFKADKGVSVAGKVIDADGKPVPNAIVTVTDRAETTMTNEQGEFERAGLAPGMIELRAMHENGAESDPVKVKAPARDIVIKFAPIEYVTGRAVDDRGAPVTSFEANEVKITAADGRFKVPAPGKTLDVWADGYVSVYLTVAKGDVGDVVLRKTPVVEGDVTDSEGKPVSGATVMGSADQGGVVTDANGRFKLTINSEEAQDLVATRGPLSGRVPLKLGTTPHIVMSRGTTVVGRVVDTSGKGIPSVVTAVNQAVMRPMEIDTDENGRFQADLARGVWLFSSRAFRSARAIDVQGERMEITLGEEAGACGAVVHSSKPIDSLWFLAKTMERSEGPWEVLGRAPGSVEVPITNPSTTVTAKGIPCGHYEIAASIESMVTSIEADLRQPQQQVEMPLPNILLIPEEETPGPETPPP